MQIKIYDYLHEHIVAIRDEVFVVEQQFKEEYDDIDNHCTYMVMYDRDMPIATCRIYQTASNTYAIGRIAVIKSYRGKGIGSLIVKEAEAHIRKWGGSQSTLSAQIRVRAFYEKLGYVAVGDSYYEEYCEHIRMNKNLK